MQAIMRLKSSDGKLIYVSELLFKRILRAHFECLTQLPACLTFSPGILKVKPAVKPQEIPMYFQDIQFWRLFVDATSVCGQQSVNSANDKWVTRPIHLPLPTTVHRRMRKTAARWNPSPPDKQEMMQ